MKQSYFQSPIFNRFGFGRIGSGTVQRVISPLVVAVIALTALAACTPKTALRGNEPRIAQLEKLEIGVARKQTVIDTIGSPSVLGTFDSNVWYYMSNRVETWAFLEKEVVEQQVLALYFDEQGVLQHVQRYSEDDARAVAYSDRVTPTAGKELGFFEQIFGNFGRGPSISP